MAQPTFIYGSAMLCLNGINLIGVCLGKVVGITN